MGVVVAVSTTDESDKPEDLFTLVDQAKEKPGRDTIMYWQIPASATMKP